MNVLALLFALACERGLTQLLHLRELRWLELVEESGALLDRQLKARSAAGELFRGALRHRVLHRDVVVE
jgi:hypothetical protein